MVKYKEIEGKVTQRGRNVAISFKPYRPTSSLLNLRTDSDNGYSFLEGAEERKEEFIEQFTALNSTCFVRSKLDNGGD